MLAEVLEARYKPGLGDMLRFDDDRDRRRELDLEVIEPVDEISS